MRRYHAYGTLLCLSAVESLVLKHIVVWKLRDRTAKATVALLVKRALEALRGRIPGPRAIEA